MLTLTGILAFVLPFSIQIVGLHALMGFVFVVLAGFHLANNFRPFRKYVQSRALWVALAMAATLTGFILWEPRSVRAVLRLSANLGPALDRFKLNEDGLVYQYSPNEHYKMVLTLKMGSAYDHRNPPQFAIWLENQGAYHIKTLYSSDSSQTERLPYWGHKLRGWEKAKQGALAEAELEVDAMSGATPNGSFDPADYILPADSENPMTYQLLIEIDQAGDVHETTVDQPSLIYSVEIDNAYPKTFQLVDLVGYPKREIIDGEESWAVYYIGEGFGSALQLIDSGLLTIDRSGAQ